METLKKGEVTPRKRLLYAFGTVRKATGPSIKGCSVKEFMFSCSGVIWPGPVPLIEEEQKQQKDKEEKSKLSAKGNVELHFCQVYLWIYSRCCQLCTAFGGLQRLMGSTTNDS